MTQSYDPVVTPSRIGQKGNDTSNKQALFLKVFSGEVLTTYNAATALKDRVRVRKISSGKSAQFPSIGKIAAEYHTPGSVLTGSQVPHNEVVISIEKMLVSSAFIANIDEAMTHYEVRSEYSKQMGQALAQTYDRQVIALAAKTCTDGSQGTSVFDSTKTAGAKKVKPDANTDASATDIEEAIYKGAVHFDECNVPAEDRFVLVTPQVYYDLLTDGSARLIDRDFSGNNGNVAGGSIMQVAGMQVVKSNNLALNLAAGSTELSDTPIPANEQADNTTLKALCMHKDAMGVVQLMDLASEAEYDIRRQGTLMVSKMAFGTGVLRPEAMYGIWNQVAD